MHDGPNWKLRLGVASLLLIVGMIGALWLIASSPRLAGTIGLAPISEQPSEAGEPAQTAFLPSPDPSPSTLTNEVAPDDDREEPVAMASEESVDDLESRIIRLEGALSRAEGSAGRADALLVAFAARRAIERGVPLGYLEPLLVERFGDAHEAEVARIITASRDPVQLDELVEQYRALGPTLRSGDPEAGLWTKFKRGLADVVAIYPADQPNPRPQARYDRALVQLRLGEVESALSETLRLPGAQAAQEWIDEARRYIATRSALDTIESAALLSRRENTPR
ncbi:hypothetical protein [Sphingomicrobium marinum]|uniref:hypothetical protein n=1 Tax=Sphingomicrobium marinum TaxID=1227950 RepID=UPI00223F0D2E|nr:hypothetical protein [Sphingomicrobium marinum]